MSDMHLNMYPREGHPGTAVRTPMLTFKPDHWCEDENNCDVVGLGGAYVGMRRQCWKCDTQRATSKVGLCQSCLVLLRSWS